MKYSDESEVYLDVMHKQDDESSEVWDILKSMHPDNRLTHDEWLEKINRIMDLVNHLQHLNYVIGCLDHDARGGELGVWKDLDDYLYVQNGKRVRLE